MSRPLWLLGGPNVIIILVSIDHHPNVLLLLLLEGRVNPMRLRLRGWSVDLVVTRVFDSSHCPQLLLLNDALHRHHLLLEVLTGKVLEGYSGHWNLRMILLKCGVVTCRLLNG